MIKQISKANEVYVFFSPSCVHRSIHTHKRDAHAHTCIDINGKWLETGFMSMLEHMLYTQPFWCGCKFLSPLAIVKATASIAVDAVAVVTVPRPYFSSKS